MNGRVALGVDDNLRHSGAVAQINEQQIAMVAPPVNPAHQHGLFASVRSAQRSAHMRSS